MTDNPLENMKQPPAEPDAHRVHPQTPMMPHQQESEHRQESLKDYTFGEWFQLFLRAVPAYMLACIIWAALIVVPLMIVSGVIAYTLR